MNDHKLKTTLRELEQVAHDIEGHARHHRQKAETRLKRLAWWSMNDPARDHIDEKELEEARAVLARLRAAYEVTQTDLEEFTEDERQAVRA